MRRLRGDRGRGVGRSREAAFFVESAEMLAAFHKATPVAAVLSDSRAMVAKTKDGRVVALLPLDWLSWTAAFEQALAAVETRARRLGATKLELRMTGTSRRSRSRRWPRAAGRSRRTSPSRSSSPRRRPSRPRRSSGMGDRGAWRLLLALAALNVLGYVDRQLVAALAPVLMAELGLSRADIGLLIGPAFVLVFGVGTLFLGAAADLAGGGPGSSRAALRCGARRPPSPAPPRAS